MGERINIQYSIDIDDLSKEVSRLLTGAFDRLSDVPLTTGASEDLLTLQTLERIDSLRRELSAVDYTLGDVANLVTAYVAFKAQDTLPPSQPTEDVPDEKPPEE